MPRFLRILVGTVAVCVSLGNGPLASAEDRAAEAILREIDAIKLPEPDLDRAKDPTYFQEFKKRRGEIRVHRAELIGTLYRIDPENPRLVKLLPVRWQWLSGRMAGPDNNEGARDLTEELNEVITRSKRPELRTEAAYIKALIAGDPFDGMGSAPSHDARLKAVDAFITFAPQDDRGGHLLYLLAFASREEPARQMTLYSRIVNEFPRSESANLSRKQLQRLTSVGKPFDLSFDDAIRGTPVSTAKLRGKILVVDFWATWCGPCVAEMPRMKELHAKYHDQGVEFIGVSLDLPEAGGLDRLKAFVGKNEIPWPQFYEGKGFEGNIATTWGIEAIPTIFLVGRDGKLVSVEAGGKLETLIQDQLKRDPLKADATPGP